MTRTERAWQLFLDGRSRAFGDRPTPEVCFQWADQFEAEAAKHKYRGPCHDCDDMSCTRSKHEESKAELYCIGWEQVPGEIHIEGQAQPRQRAESLLKRCNEDKEEGASPFFLVEVRRVK